jgi:hypothetical protein
MRPASSRGKAVAKVGRAFSGRRDRDQNRLRFFFGDAEGPWGRFLSIEAEGSRRESSRERKLKNHGACTHDGAFSFLAMENRPVPR